ncbi:MAG: primosomal protein N' [Lachnospiraceae bacterium]|nr:primosomal protein N' [Lachnospiraceae bacterium]
MLFAAVIIDISVDKLDRPFTYRIPGAMEETLKEGMEVTVPFGKADTERKAWVLSITDHSAFPAEQCKEILRINERSVSPESRTMQLAIWMKRRYGGTLALAMRTVLPVKKKVKEMRYKRILRLAAASRLEDEIASLSPVRFAGRIRLYRALLTAEELPEQIVKEKLQISASVLKTAEKDGLICIKEEQLYRAPVPKSGGKCAAELTDEQRTVTENILTAYHAGDKKPVLLHGITGSGKTEIYMELIADAIAGGRQAIVLIPEIALTFQTLMRFYARFGERVSVMHSKLSDGERYDQYERARKGELDIIIGPRSALFTPFPATGVIIIDEEHEGSYKSEKMPKYHAREVAEYLAEQNGALLVLGSATPSVESYFRAESGEAHLYKLTQRYGNARLPQVYIADMREELKKGNRSFFSERLKQLLTERIVRGEQSMLFINRRGVAGFVSCRSCGHVLQCPHCSVSMTEHRDGRMYCHYCGHSEAKPKLCPDCGSKYIAGFRAGTEKIEEELKKLYPAVRISRMDADTTKNRDDYERILSAFADGEADILVGTQMIVKGHDFPNVTLVGAIAADISLNAADCRGAERSFQLLAQAAGRAGRGDKPGEVVIQTYRPEHYALRYAAAQDYESFYKEEIAYRELADYPPASHLLLLQFFSKSEEDGMERAKVLKEELKKRMGEDAPEILGPAAACIGKLRDVCRTGMYLRHKERRVLERAAEEAWALQEELKLKEGSREVLLQFDPDPVSMF